MTEAADGGQMSLVDHLTEFRSRLIKCALAVAVGAVVCWILYFQILDFLLEPYCAQNEGELDSSVFGDGCQLLVTDPLQPFSVRLTIAGYGGLVLAMPVILWQIWRFVAPGLYKHEKRYALPFVIGGAILFFLGAGLAYWSLPRALEFLADIGGPDLVTGFSPDRYLGFVIKMIVAFGIGFEFPIVLIFLQLLGIVSTTTLRRGRRYAMVGIVALVAVITPSGDPFTLLVLSVPMYVFYEFAILFGVIRNRRARRREAPAGPS